jgi:hypothetical protein
MAAVKNIVRYVAGTQHWGLWFSRHENLEAALTVFSDSDYARDVDKRKSTTGVICFLSGSPITCQSMKQKVVAQSSCEAKYIAAANATCQALWLSRVLAEIQGTVPGVPLLKVDNKSTISLIKNPVLSSQSRHIEVKYHLVRESASRGLIQVEFIGTKDQLGDILTKALDRLKFQSFVARSAWLTFVNSNRRPLCPPEDGRNAAAATTLKCFVFYGGARPKPLDPPPSGGCLFRAAARRRRRRCCSSTSRSSSSCSLSHRGAPPRITFSDELLRDVPGVDAGRAAGSLPQRLLPDEAPPTYPCPRLGRQRRRERAGRLTAADLSRQLAMATRMRDEALEELDAPPVASRARRGRGRGGRTGGARPWHAGARGGRAQGSRRWRNSARRNLTRGDSRREKTQRVERAQDSRQRRHLGHEE